MGREGAWLSVLGLYNYDETLFDDFAIPEQLDKEVLIENILSELAELEVLYTNPISFKRIIKFWSRMRLPVWQHLYDTTVYNYDPINPHNMITNNQSHEEGVKDITDDETLSSRDDYISNTSENSTDNSKEKTDNNIHNSGNQTGTDNELVKGNDASKSVEQDNNYVVGFNSADKVLKNSEEDTISSTDEWNTDTKANDSKNWTEEDTIERNINTNSKSERSRWDKSGRLKEDVSERTGKHEDLRDINNSKNSFGNTGIYSKQMLIKQEREIAELSIYGYIVRDFKKRFCIQVW